MNRSVRTTPSFSLRQHASPIRHGRVSSLGVQFVNFDSSSIRVHGFGLTPGRSADRSWRGQSALGGARAAGRPHLPPAPRCHSVLLCNQRGRMRGIAARLHVDSGLPGFRDVRVESEAMDATSRVRSRVERRGRGHYACSGRSGRTSHPRSARESHMGLSAAGRASCDAGVSAASRGLPTLRYSGGVDRVRGPEGPGHPSPAAADRRRLSGDCRQSHAAGRHAVSRGKVRRAENDFTQTGAGPSRNRAAAYWPRRNSVRQGTTVLDGVIRCRAR